MSRLRPAGGVGVVDEGETVYAAALPDGPIVVLEEVAAFIWVEACNGERESIADRVAEVTGAGADEVRTDVEAFVDDLVARGLLAADPG